MGENIVVNVDFEGNHYQKDAVFNNSIQVVPANIAWEDFELMLKVYADQEDIQVCYTDTDSNLIKIKSQEELDASFTLAKQCNNTLHLRVQCGTPLVLKEQSQDGGTVTADLRNQRVTMTTESKTMTTLHCDAVPIAMETGERMSQNDAAGCDWVVTKETGEKQCVSKAVVTSSAAAAAPSENKASNKKRFFFLIHQESGLVLEGKSSKQFSGMPVVLSTKKDRQAGHQLWYVHETTKTLRCKSSDLCLEASDHGAVAAQYVKGRTSQMWKIKGSRITQVSNTHWVIGPMEGVDLKPGMTVMACRNKDIERLAWLVEYRKPETLLDLSKSARLLKATHARQNRGLGDVLEIDKELDELGEHVQKLKIKVPPTAKDKSKSGSHVDGQQHPKQRDPPDWFLNCMKELKTEMVESVSSEVASRTVSLVLRGLEGAVINSVGGATMHAPSAPVEEIPPQSPPIVYTHYGIVCDHCEETIVGPRYKCGNCEDYDLCSACESLSNTVTRPHPEDHVFLKIYRPLMSAGHTKDGTLVPLLRVNLYRHEARLVRKLEHQSLVIDAARREAEKRPSRPPCKDQIKKKQEKLRKKVEKTEEKLKKKEKRRMDEEKSLPGKKEKLELPDVLVPDHMDAEFLYDTTIPDGTHMQPLTTFVKTWRMKNTGTIPWTRGTSLVNIWGNMMPVQDEISVTYTGVGEDIYISAEIVAPAEPGVYQSHWRLAYCGLHFGHRIWCSIVVDPKEVLEERLTKTASNLPDLEVVKVKEEEEEVKDDEQVQCYIKHDSKVDWECGESSMPRSDQLQEGVEVKVTECGPEYSEEDSDSVTKGDIVVRTMMVNPETPEIREVCTARASQTVTPNNTPQESRDPTSPHTPKMLSDRETIWSLSTSSSVEVVSEDDISQDTAFTSELVSQRMAQLEVKPDIDLQSISSYGDTSDSDSEDDFFVVPIPDFFNPALPPSKAASTSVYIKKDEMQPCLVSEPLSDSQRLESQPLLSASHSFEYELLDVENTGRLLVSDTEPEEIEVLTLEKVTEEQTNHRDEGIEPMAEQEIVVVQPELVKVEIISEMPERSRSLDVDVLEVIQRSHSVTDVNPGSTEVNPRSERGESEVSMTEVKRRSQPSEKQTPNEETVSDKNTEAVANRLVATAIDVASKATTGVYNTAKDVYQSLKGKKEYVPPSNKWSPPDEKWTPPPQEWTPPEQTWPLPQPAWTPQPSGDKVTTTTRDTVRDTTSTSPTSSTPMLKLIEMGFADRQLNKKLLQKHDNDLEKVIQELLSSTENDWHSTRH